jgi:hypothetical protein
MPSANAVMARARKELATRTSTVEFQDPVTWRGWQLEAAEGVVGKRGVIVAEFLMWGVRGGWGGGIGRRRRRCWPR